MRNEATEEMLVFTTEVCWKYEQVKTIVEGAEASLEEFYRILDCDCITATYPWEERAALVTDDNGLFTEKLFSRYIPELEQPIKGNFFICGLGEEDFAELPQDLIQKFRERFWVPEAFVSMFGQMAVIQMDDGTKPE